MLKRYPFNYNCIFQDRTIGGIYLIPGERWSFPEVAPNEETEEETEQQIVLEELIDDNVEQDTETLRSYQSSEQTAVITSDISTRDICLQTSLDVSYGEVEVSDDQFMDDELQDQEEIAQTEQYYEFVDISDIIDTEEILNQQYEAVGFSASNLDPLPQIPPNLTVDNNRRYNKLRFKLCHSLIEFALV